MRILTNSTFKSLDDLKNYCTQAGIEYANNGKTLAKYPYVEPKKWSIKKILLGLGASPEEILSYPQYYGYRDYTNKKGRGFQWSDYTGAEVAAWIVSLWKNKMREFPTAEEIKKYNIFKMQGLKICSFH